MGFPEKNLRRAKKIGRKIPGRAGGRSPAIVLIALIAAAFYLWPSLWPKETAPDAGAAGAADLFSGRVSRVPDGDSLEVKVKGRVIRIRLYGVDAPELHQSHGPESRDWLADRLLNLEVRIQTMDVDQYDRVVALVHLEETIINQALVSAGQAWVYNRYCSIDLCRQLKKDEAAARRQGLGLWAEPKPTPPWRWRRHQG